jgi:hypothetical protein
MADDNNTNPSTLDQGVDHHDQAPIINGEKYEKQAGNLVAKEPNTTADTKVSDAKSWTMAEIDRVVSSEIIPDTRQRLNQFGVGLTRRNDFRLKDLARRVERQTRQDFAGDLKSGPVSRRLRNYDIKSYTMRMITANAALGSLQFQKSQHLPYMRKSLSLAYEKVNLLKKVVSGIGGLQRHVVAKLEAIKLNTAAVAPSKESRFAKIRKAIKDKIDDRIATNFSGVILAGYDEKYKKYVSPTLSRLHAKMAQKDRHGGLNGGVGVLSRKLNDLRHSVAKAGDQGGKVPASFNKLASTILSGAVKATQRVRLPQGLSQLAAKPLSSATGLLAKVQPFETPGFKPTTPIPPVEKAIDQLTGQGHENSSLLRFLKRDKKEGDVYRKTLLDHVKAIRYQLVPGKHTVAGRGKVIKTTKALGSLSLQQHLPPVPIPTPSLRGKPHVVIHSPAPHHDDIHHPKPSVLTTLFGKLSDKIAKIDKSLMGDRKAKALFDKAQAKQKALMDKLAARAKVRKGSYEDLEEQRRKGRGFIPWGKMGKFGFLGGAASEAEMGGHPHLDDPDNHPVDSTGIPSIAAMGLMGLAATGKSLARFGWKGAKLASRYGWRAGKKIVPAAARTGAKGAGILGRFGLREIKGVAGLGARGLAATGAASAGGVARLLGKTVKGIPLLGLGAESIDYLTGQRVLNWRNLAKSGIALGGGALGGLAGGLATAGMGGEFVGGIGGYAAGTKLGNTLLGDDATTNKTAPQDPRAKKEDSLSDRFFKLLNTRPDFLKKKSLAQRLRDTVSTGSTDPNRSVPILKAGQALRYGLTAPGMKYGFQKAFYGDRYSNGDYAAGSSLASHLNPTNFSIGSSTGILGWTASTGRADNPTTPFYAYVTLVLDAYGVKNRSLYAYLHSLELSQEKINSGKSKPFDDSDMTYMSGRFGLDGKNKDAVNYFKMWYKRRFLPALALITKVTKAHRLTLSSVSGADDKAMASLNGDLKKEIAASDLKTLGLEASGEAYNKYAKVGSKAPGTVAGSSVTNAKPYDPRNPRNIPNGQGGSEGYLGRFGSFLNSATGGLFGRLADPSGNNQPAPASRNQAQIVKGGVKDQPQFKAAYQKLPPTIKKMVDGSKTLQFVLWSTSIQHGGDAAALIFQKDYSDKLDEKGYIRSIYQDRSTRFSNLGSMDRTSAIQHLGEEQQFVEGMRTGTSTPDMATMGREVNNVINPSGNSNLGYDPSSAKPAAITGNVASRAKDAMQYLMSKKYTKIAAAGIIGNLIEESALMTNRPGDGGRAFGIAQWHADRRGPIARQFNKPVEAMNFHEQLDAVDWEIRTGRGVTGGGGLFNALNASKDAGEAARMMMNRYERPAERQHNGVVRTNNALGVLKAMGDTTPAPSPNAAPASSGKPASSGTKSTPSKQATVKPTSTPTVAHPQMVAHGKSLDDHADALRQHTAALLKPQPQPTPTPSSPSQGMSIFSPIINAAKSTEHFISMSMAKTSLAAGDM